MFGYVLILPFIASVLVTLLQRQDEPIKLSFVDDPAYHWFLLAAAILVFVASILIATGFVLLRFSPADDEQKAANKFLIAYGIAVASAVVWIAFDINQLNFVRRIAVAYGTFYLLGYFQVLAANRDNSKLIWWSNFTNGFFVVLILGAILGAVLVGMKVIPTIASLSIFGVAAGVMYFAWMKTLWHALQATRPVAKDFEPQTNAL